MSEQKQTGPTAYDESQKDKRERVGFWLDEITASAKYHRDNWWDRGEEVVSTYRGITSDGMEVFNILWSNVETLKPIVYSHVPKPEVERRFLEKDSIGADMAIIMERSIEFLQHIPGKEFDKAITKVRDDFLLPGRGVARVVYDAVFEEEEREVQTEPNPITGMSDTEIEIEEVKSSEEAYVKYVYWKDFLHSNGIMWDQVWWVAFASDMTRADLREAFGEEKANKIPLAGQVLEREEFVNDRGDYDFDWAVSREEGYARVWEIWDKRSRTVVVVSEGCDRIIDENDDPYELENFFPTPEPLYAIETTGSLLPVPEYTMYQYQAEELNVITRRMTRLTEALKARGICDADIKSLTRMFDGEENEIIPDEEFGKLAAAGGTKGAIEWAPITEIASVLAALTPRQRECLDIIYEITGLSDILRGSSDPRETATAVRKKGMFGSLRIRDRQKKIQTYCRDLMRLKGELIANLFDPETLILMSGVEQRPEIMSGMEEIMAKLRDNAMRDYTINVQTDSTIVIDEEVRQEQTVAFFSAAATLLQQIVPAAQEGIIPMPVAQEFLMFLAKRFEAGRELENAIESISQQPPKQEEEDPAAAAKAQEAQAKIQIEQQKLQLEAAKLEQEGMLEQARLQLEAAKLAADQQSDDADRQIKMAVELINLEIVKENRAGQGSN